MQVVKDRESCVELAEFRVVEDGGECSACFVQHLSPCFRTHCIIVDKKCNTGCMSTGKTYYNDQHQNKKVIEHQEE